MQHTILQAFDRDELSKLIEEAIAEGWELHGNLAFTAYYAEQEHVTIYAQAMVTEEAAPTQEDIERVAQGLKELLDTPEDQLSPAQKKDRDDITRALQDASAAAKREGS